ncbi:MAG TPA: tripartite tricarboxylate transporter substrate binding protein, partial [Burkholderiales bacterium]|nr:tripartite tricarboxylate transporter substrate binding protein [Burkholderiales bacterium]
LAAGGPTDILSRMVAQPLSEALGKQIVVDNRPGASANIAAEMAAKSPPDGYTLFIAGSGNFAINPSLFSKLPYDPVRDFEPIALLATAPYLIAVHPSVPANSVKELIALAKAKPGALNYGAVTGNGAHLATELFNTAAGIKMTHIPYKGANLATNDVLSGLIQVTFASTPGAMPFVKAGRLKALAITSSKRATALPDLPTVAETIPGFEATVWYGIAAPAGTPKPIIQRLNREIVAVVKNPALRERLIAADYEPAVGTPEQFGAFIKSEIVKWAKAVKISGAHAD